MMYASAISYADLLISFILDIRFQILFFSALFLRWKLGLSRRRKAPANKTVFITGCDSGMGHRMARRFDEMKMNVFAGCLHPEGSGAQNLKKSCSDRLHIVPLDVTKEDQIKEAVAYVKANLPHGQKSFDCLINNAGILSYACFDFMTTKMCEEVMNVNFMGAVRVTKHFFPLISESQGRIITITSILGRLYFPNTSVYTASKHALDGFFSSLRYELMDRGIRVVIVEPGNFSKTTNIMQWTQEHIEEMWENLSEEEKQNKFRLHEETKKIINVQKDAPEKQEKTYKLLLRDVEDALLAEEPSFYYVSAPLKTRIILWLLRMIPEKLSFKMTSIKTME